MTYETTPSGGTRRALEQALFGDRRRTAFAVADGACCPELRERIAAFGPPQESLHPGGWEAWADSVAPRLMELRRDDPFPDWLFERCWGRGRCVWLTSGRGIAEVGRHLRRLTFAALPDGQPVSFRFFDPRVMRGFLPGCDGPQLELLYGETVESYLLEDAEGGLLEMRRPEAPPGLAAARGGRRFQSRPELR